MSNKTITFKGREYRIGTNMPVPAQLAAHGLKAQLVIEGKRGTIKFLQIWNTRYGILLKSISLTGRVETELVNTEVES
jgi:hypothetical protein